MRSSFLVITFLFCVLVVNAQMPDVPDQEEIEKVFGKGTTLNLMTEADLKEMFQEIREKDCKTDLAQQVLNAIGQFKKEPNVRITATERDVDEVVDGRTDGKKDGWIEFSAENVTLIRRSSEDLTMKIKEFERNEVVEFYTFTKGGHLMVVGCDYMFIGVEGLPVKALFRDIRSACTNKGQEGGNN